MPTVDPESYLEGAHIWAGDTDPSELSPIDFYWWTMEEAGGEFDKAVCSVQNADDALKFAEGVREERLERSDGTESRFTAPKGISREIKEVLEFSSGTYLHGDPLKQFGLLRDWSVALDEFLSEEGKGPETLTKKMLENLDAVLAAIEERKVYLQELADEIKDRSMEKYSLSQDDVDELQLMALGVSSVDRAEVLGVDTAKVSDRRTTIVYNKLGGKSHSHAVRIALEEGIISLDGPAKTEPGIDLIPRSTRLLDLYSQGMNKDEIADEENRSPASVNARLSELVGTFSADSRQHMVYKAIKEGVITIEKGKYFHLNNAISHLHSVSVSVLSARAGFEMFLGRSQEPAARPQGSESLGRVHDGKLRSPAARIFGQLAGLNDSLLSFLGEEYSRVSSKHPLLDEAETRELELEAQGDMISSRDIGPAQKRNLNDLRSAIREKLRARSMAQSIARAVSIGALPVQWSRRYEEPTLPDSDPMAEIIPLIAEGMTREEIMEVTGTTGRILTIGMQRANEMFSTSNASSLVYKAFERGIVIPDNGYKPLHISANFLNRAEVSFCQAISSLTDFDGTAINRHLSGLSESQIRELEYAAEGKTSAERAEEEKITLGGFNLRRSRIIESLGAENIVHAVAIAVERGILEAEPSKDVELDPEQTDVIETLAKGGILAEIQKRKGIARNTMAYRMSKIRDALSANTNAQAVFHAYRSGILELE